MSKDMKANVSGVVAILLVIIQHYLGYAIPDWVSNTILIPLILAALGHVAWLVGKPGNPDNPPPSTPVPPANPG